MSDILRPYEGIVVFHPESTLQDQKDTFKKHADVLKSFKGKFQHVDTWGKRNLANPVEGLERGVYFHMTFETTPSAIAELERVLRINEKVLRFQHTRLEDGTKLAQYVENFKENLAANLAKEREREAKFQQRKAQRAQARSDDF